VGSFVRSTREAQQLSQHQVAALTRDTPGRVSRAMISSIERGQHLPGLEALAALSHALHFDPMEIFERVDMSMTLPVDLTHSTQDELRRQAEEHYWAGNFRRALAIYDAMLERLILEAPEDPVERARSQARIEINRACALRRCGALAAARGAAERAITVADGEPRLQAEGYIVLVGLLTQQGHPPLARDAAERAVALSRLADGRTQGLALMEQGLVLFRAGAFDEALPVLSEALRLVKVVRDHRHRIHLEGNIALCLEGMGRRRPARTRLMKAVDLAREHAVPVLEASWLIELARLELDDDHIDDAERFADAAQRRAKSIGHELSVFRAEWVRHRVARRRDPQTDDRHRLAYLRRLYVRLKRHEGVPEIREFRDTILVPAEDREPSS
jgi:transcriptional regulator with XRE-family HTH domain